MGCAASQPAPSGDRQYDAQRVQEDILARAGADGLVYFVNRWRVQNGERRAGRMLGFRGGNAMLKATWAQRGPGTVPWELLPADEWNPNTGQRVERGTWDPLRGNTGSAGGFEHHGGKLYYIVNRWKTVDGERRAGRMLGFNGENVILEATWAQPGGDKVVWELFPADEWDPNTGQRVERGTWDPLAGSDGSPGEPLPPIGGERYYIVNRWKAHDGERRAGRMLGFNGENVILEATWARPGGGKVPWEALNATQFNPTSGARESFSPLLGDHGHPAPGPAPQFMAVRGAYEPEPASRGAASSYEELRSLGSTTVTLVHESSGGQVYKSDERMGSPPEHVIKLHGPGTRGTPLRIGWHEAMTLTMLIDGKPIRTTGDYRHGCRVVEVGLVGRSSDPHGKWELEPQDEAGTHFHVRNVTHHSEYLCTQGGILLTSSSRRDVFIFTRGGISHAQPALPPVVVPSQIAPIATGHVVMGRVLAAEAGGSSSAPPPVCTLVEMVEVLTRELELSGAMHEVIHKAALELGVETAGKSLIEIAASCMQALAPELHMHELHLRSDQPHDYTSNVQ